MIGSDTELAYIPLYVAGPVVTKTAIPSKVIESPSKSNNSDLLNDSLSESPKHILHDYSDDFESNEELLSYAPLPVPSTTGQDRNRNRIPSSLKEARTDVGESHSEFSEKSPDSRVILERTLGESPRMNYLEKDLSMFPAENPEDLFLSAADQVMPLY